MRLPGPRDVFLAFTLPLLVACASSTEPPAASPAKTLVESEGGRFIPVPAGDYRPLRRDVGEPETTPVRAFRLAENPVTNAEFLRFLRENTAWRRSRVPPLYADSGYLADWSGDMEPGPKAPPDAPVVRVSWFAARAYAHWNGARLPSVAEWEYAASAGYRSADGRDEPEFTRDLYAWLAKPFPAVPPPVSVAKVNRFGVRGLHGLVWEWTEDFDSDMGAPESRGDAARDNNLFCGGASIGAKEVDDYAAFVRRALRTSLKGADTVPSLGFRCARDHSATATSTPTRPAERSPTPEDPTGPDTPPKDSLYRGGIGYVDDSGRPLGLDAWRGRPVVLAMFFSSCGYACPRLVADLAGLREELPEGVREKTVFVLVSFDVKRDTPATLKAFRESRRLDSNWALLHGSAETVRELAMVLGVKFKSVANGGFQHSNRLTVLDAQGRIVYRRDGLTGEHAELVRHLVEVASTKPKSNR